MQLNPQLAAAIEQVDALRKTVDDHMQIPRIEGEMLHHIALAVGAKLIVEVGTSYGFSGIFWASAMRQTGGMLHTIDISQKKYDASRRHFELAGLTAHIVSHFGDARVEIPKIAGLVDIAFLDGTDKSMSREFFELIWPKIHRGGSVLTDNTHSHPEELADYVKFCRARTDASSIGLSVGNGVEWTTKL